MTLHMLKCEDKEVRIYARKGKDIVDLIKYYRERARKDGVFNDPRLAVWVKKVPTKEDIMKVEKGELFFQAGLVKIPEKDDNRQFYEELKVLPDFSVFVNDESLVYFELFRQRLPQLKRTNLYKIQLDGGLAAGLTFIPEDVMRSIMSYDLFPHLERARKALEEIANLQHPNLKVGFKEVKGDASTGN